MTRARGGRSGWNRRSHVGHWLAARALDACRLVLGAALVSVPLATASAQAPIKIGDINSYSNMALFTDPYRRGAELAVEQINAAGGINGRPLQVIFRDDAAKAGDAIRQAEELTASEQVVALAGGFTSSVCLALADFALQRKIPFVCGIAVSDAVVWEKGNRYTFHTAASTYMQTQALAEAAAKLPAKTWATVAPNYEYGTSFVARFKEHLLKLRPDVKFVAEQWPALGKLDPGPTLDALLAAQPDAIFNAEFGTDLIRLVREVNTRDAFKGKYVVSALTGQPEYLDTLKAETPEGWIVTGYPWQTLDTPEHKAFREAYQKKFNDYPRWGAMFGYIGYKALAAAIAKAGGTDPEKIVDALGGLSLPTPVGEVTFRAADNQATLTVFTGKLTKKGDKGEMVDWIAVDGAKLLPPPAEIAKLRPAK
ncbi:ABC transporter substrate-binding protein [Xanthobacter dioxanivorans]|uniref:ABC transporter substrate-binding protein n=1 Tax=Xanthobacter dioxanivorans TaxID=2528964 RepID=A0A974PMF6_9HYPH|nr:ABC transporter substrate-binding protein [Xanthobacter dioxanivorans]QRG06254.1 ABC transporter substrate-binding protein [Xanthobacter dioxanivorans]